MIMIMGSRDPHTTALFVLISLLLQPSDGQKESRRMNTNRGKIRERDSIAELVCRN